MGNKVILQLSNGKVLLFCFEDALADDSVFFENLELLNGRLTVVLKTIFKYLSERSRKEMLLKNGVARLVRENPCQITRPEVKYPYMIKELLYAAYCGMNSEELWDGRYSVVDDLLYRDDGAGCYLKSDAVKDALYEQCVLCYEWQF